MVARNRISMGQSQFVKRRGRDDEPGILQSFTDRADGIRDRLHLFRHI